MRLALTLPLVLPFAVGALAVGAFALGALALLPLPALADGGVDVVLPDTSMLSDAQADEVLRAAVLATVIGQNCAGFLTTDGEWGLLTGTADAIAYGRLGLDAGRYDDAYWTPAFARQAEPGACAEEGPKLQGLLRLLEDLGGSRVPAGPGKG